jgi:hypothetical protein
LWNSSNHKTLEPLLHLHREKTKIQNVKKIHSWENQQK